MADEIQQEAPLSAGYQVKVNPKGGITPAGNVALDPSQNAELLAQMQEMVKRRENPMNIFLEGLKDATAWGAGRDQGPTEALAVRGAQRQKEEDSLYNMKAQMAAMKAASAQQEQFNKLREAELGGGTAGGGAGAPAEFGTIGALPPLARSTLAAARTPEEYNKLKARYAELAMNPEWAKQTEYVTPSGEIDKAPLYQVSRGMTPTARGATGASVPLESIQRAVFGQESSYGKADTSKPNYAGAVGPMQILPDTFESLKKEGLIPKDADIANPTHNKAAGDALLGKYYKQYNGDVNKVLAAYYGGEGAINKDGSINVDWKDKQNPKAPTVGQYIAQVKQKVGATIPTTVEKPTFSEAQANLKYREEQGKTMAEATKKEVEKFKEGTEAGSVTNQLYLSKRLGELTEKYKNNPNIVGLLNDKGIGNAVATLLAKGITTPVGSISFGGLEDAFQKARPNATKDEIEARQEIQQILKSYALEASKVASGQGAMSDFERQMFEQIAGSTSNSMDMLRRVQQVMQARADFNNQIGRAFENTYKSGKPQDFQEFKRSDVYRGLVDQHREKLMGITADLKADPSRVSAQPATKTYNWDADKEARYQEYKKRQGNQ